MRRTSRVTRASGVLAAAVACTLLLALGAVWLNAAWAQAFNWKRHAGTQVRVFAPIIPQLDKIKAWLPQFEQLTGIRVTIETFPDAQLRQKTSKA